MRDEPTAILKWSTLASESPARARVGEIPLVVVRFGDEVNVLYGLCPHRAAELASGTIEGTQIVCADHGWGFECKSGRSEGVDGAALRRFDAWVDEARDEVMVDAHEVRKFAEDQIDAFAYAL